MNARQQRRILERFAYWKVHAFKEEAAPLDPTEKAIVVLLAYLDEDKATVKDLVDERANPVEHPRREEVLRVIEDTHKGSRGTRRPNT